MSSMNKTASPQCQVVETKRSDNSVDLDDGETKTSSLCNIKTTNKHLERYKDGKTAQIEPIRERAKGI